MLAVPTKKSKSADWGIPLRAYIVENYGEKVADEQTESLAKLNQAREWVLSNSKKTDEQSLEHVKSYLRMLGAVEARFPIRETHVNITFTWYDSFKPAKKFMHHRIEAERAGVLFNYAAMESYSGMLQDRSTQIGNQQAVTHFLTAARYFQYLRDVYIPEKVDGPLTSDLSPEGLTMLTNLMLAQSQICIFEKAIRGKMSSGVLAKIAAGAKQLYFAALQAATSHNLVEVIDPSWSEHMSFQVECLEASACFHFSKVILKEFEETSEGFGKRIAYLTQSKTHCDNILKKRATLQPGQLATIENLLTTVNKELTKATTDNNTIYMDLVPELGSLEAPEHKILAKSDMDKVDALLVGPILPGADVDDTKVGANLFKELLPGEVQVSVAIFKSRISELVEKATKMVNNNENAVKDALTGANLPGAIEAGGGTKGLPDTVWASILDQVHQFGGVNGLKSTLLANGKKAEQLTAVLYEAQQKLTVDETNDLRHRQLWGDRWGLPPATQANALVKKDLARYKGLLTEARESDRLLLLKINSGEIGSVLQDVSKQKELIDKLMPDPGDVDDDEQVEGLRSKLRMSYINLQTHLQKVTSKLDAFVYSTSKANIVGDLYRKDRAVSDLVSNQDEVQNIINGKIAVYEEPFEEIKKLAEDDTSLLNRVLTDNANYLASRRENAATKETERALARIEFGIQKFTELHKHIKEGEKFYKTLTEKVERLRVLIGDHCLTRDMLSNDQEQVLRRGGNAGQQQPVTTQAFGGTSQTPYNFTQQSHVPVVPVVATATPQVQHSNPTPSNSGLSMFEQMKLAQIEAEKQGTLNTFAGESNPSPSPSPQPAPTTSAQDDMQAAQTALALEQQEILARIQTRQALKESKRTDYTKELNDVKNIVGNEFKDKLILSHLKSNQGNVQLTVSNLFDGTAPKKKKGKGFGIFGGKKKDKNKNGGPIVGGGTGGNLTGGGGAGGGGGGNVW